MITGFRAERYFVKTVSKLGKTIIPATDDQNKKEHIDFIIDGKSYEVKGQKRLRRIPEGKENLYKNLYDYRPVIWLEVVGISGYPGWLYGKADYIAHVVGNEFWIIPRKALLKYTLDLVKDETIYTYPRKAKWYGRKNHGKKDKMTYVEIQDIEHLVINKLPICHKQNTQNS